MSTLTIVTIAIIAQLIIGVFALKLTALILYGKFRIEIAGIKEVFIIIGLSLVWPLSLIVFTASEIYNNRRQIIKWLNEIYFKI